MGAPRAPATAIATAGDGAAVEGSGDGAGDGTAVEGSGVGIGAGLSVGRADGTGEGNIVGSGGPAKK